MLIKVNHWLAEFQGMTLNQESYTHRVVLLEIERPTTSDYYKFGMEDPLTQEEIERYKFIKQINLDEL